jgi:hypothetical protein
MREWRFDRPPCRGRRSTRCVRRLRPFASSGAPLRMRDFPNAIKMDLILSEAGVARAVEGRLLPMQQF